MTPTLTPKQRALIEAQVDSPSLICDLDLVQAQWQALRQAYVFADLFASIKANPAPAILRLWIEHNAWFETASLGEIKACLHAGADPQRILFGNTIKKQSDIAKAYALGVRDFACDAEDDLDKFAQVAPGAHLQFRLAIKNPGASWPLDRKFGSPPEQILQLWKSAVERSLQPIGLAIHVGSQQHDPQSWNAPISLVAQLASELAATGASLQWLNLGGGLPAPYGQAIPPLADFAQATQRALHQAFGDRLPRISLEPGRALVATSAAMLTEVVHIRPAPGEPDLRWVYLDVGRFNGLAETHLIRYPLSVLGEHQSQVGDVVLAGPSCDGEDLLYPRGAYQLPLDLKVGDRLILGNAGAYSTTYASQGFNGLPAPHEHYL